MKVTVYGEGGFDPSKTNNNVVEMYEGPDDPTTDAEAVIAAVRDPDQPTPSIEDRLAAIECLLLPPDGSSGLSNKQEGQS